MKTKTTLAVFALFALAFSGPAAAKDGIQIVGSSTVYPFSAVVAERFGRETEFPAPRIEATGSGGGMKLFCAGTDDDRPDITNSSAESKNPNRNSAPKTESPTLLKSKSDTTASSSPKAWKDRRWKSPARKSSSPSPATSPTAPAA